MRHLAIITLLVALLSGCTIGRPLNGPGYNQRLKALTGDPERVVVVAITHAELDRSHRRPFDKKSQEIYKSLESYPGYIAGSIRLRLLGEHVWTYSIWENENDLKNFINSKQHMGAIYSTDKAIKRMRSIQVKMPAGKVPIQWKEIEKIISTQEMHKYTHY